MVSQRSRKYKAWLITWEWIGEHAKREDKIVAVLDPRIAPIRVREFVEVLHMNIFYGVGEKVYYALHRRKNPYPAFYTNRNETRWPPVIECGHNPHLMAHLVENLTVERHEDGTETANWQDVRSKRWHTFTCSR